MEIPSGTTSSTINRENSTPKVKDEFSFTRLIVEDMLFHWNLLQGCTHQSLWLESPKAQCSTFQSWDWWCTKGKVKVNRFLVFWAVNLLSFPFVYTLGGVPLASTSGFSPLDSKCVTHKIPRTWNPRENQRSGTAWDARGNDQGSDWQSGI